MPLTCEFNGADFDSTNCTSDEWLDISDVKNKGKLTCRECGWKLHTKELRTEYGKTRFFAHNPSRNGKRPDCSSENESPEHRQLKNLVADIVRSHGWTARVEATPEDGDRKRWRADVLAVSSSGDRKIAFEIQLSSMSASKGLDRTRKYQNDSIEVVWIGSKNQASWFGSIPSIGVNDDHQEVIDGLSQLLDEEWSSLNLPLDEFIGAVLSDDVKSIKIATQSGLEHSFVTTEDLRTYEDQQRRKSQLVNREDRIHETVSKSDESEVEVSPVVAYEEVLERVLHIPGWTSEHERFMRIRNDALDAVLNEASERVTSFQSRPFCPAGKMWLGRRDDQQLDVGDPCPYCSTTLESRTSVN